MRFSGAHFGSKPGKHNVSVGRGPGKVLKHLLLSLFQVVFFFLDDMFASCFIVNLNFSISRCPIDSKSIEWYQFRSTFLLMQLKTKTTFKLASDPYKPLLVSL